MAAGRLTTLHTARVLSATVNESFTALGFSAGLDGYPFDTEHIVEEADATRTHTARG